MMQHTSVGSRPRTFGHPSIPSSSGDVVTMALPSLPRCFILLIIENLTNQQTTPGHRHHPLPGPTSSQQPMTTERKSWTILESGDCSRRDPPQTFARGANRQRNRPRQPRPDCNRFLSHSKFAIDPERRSVTSHKDMIERINRGLTLDRRKRRQELGT